MCATSPKIRSLAARVRIESESFTAGYSCNPKTSNAIYSGMRLVMCGILCRGLDNQDVKYRAKTSVICYVDFADKHESENYIGTISQFYNGYEGDAERQVTKLDFSMLKKDFLYLARMAGSDIAIVTHHEMLDDLQESKNRDIPVAHLIRIEFSRCFEALPAPVDPL